MKIAIIDCRADDKTVYTLENLGMYVIPTVKLTQLYDAIASHADIQIHYLGNNKFLCAPEVFEHYKKLIPNNFSLIKGSKPIGSEYPYDIAYNTAVLKDFVICSTAYTAIEILSEYRRTKKKILNVRQGYSKCSTCVVNGRAIMTSDIGIANTAQEHGIDVLKLNTGHIKLKGMEYGFIGGATGLIDNSTLAVNGDLATHPNQKEIEQFCNNHGVNILTLKSGVLEDIGTIISNTYL